MEAVFRPKVSGFFLVNSGHFLANSNRFLLNYDHLCVNFREKRPESHRKNPEIFRLEYCLHFHCFSGIFLQDPVTFPPLSSETRSFPEAGIIDLGINTRIRQSLFIIIWINTCNEKSSTWSRLYNLFVSFFFSFKKTNEYFILFLFRNNLNDNQICLIKCIAIHFLRVNHNNIHIEKCWWTWP
jgi:hypothetical protein